MTVRIHAYNFHNNRVEDGAEVEASWGPLCLCHGAWVGENMGDSPGSSHGKQWLCAGEELAERKASYRGNAKDAERMTRGSRSRTPGILPQVRYVSPWGRNHGQRRGRLVKEGFPSGHAMWSVGHLLHETLTPSLVFDPSYSSDSLLPNLPSCPNPCFYSTVCHTWRSAVLRKK